MQKETNLSGTKDLLLKSTWLIVLLVMSPVVLATDEAVAATPDTMASDEKALQQQVGRQLQAGQVEEAVATAQQIEAPFSRSFTIAMIADAQQKNRDAAGAERTFALARAAAATATDPAEKAILLAGLAWFWEQNILGNRSDPVLSAVTTATIGEASAALQPLSDEQVTQRLAAFSNPSKRASARAAVAAALGPADGTGNKQRQWLADAAVEAEAISEPGSRVRTLNEIALIQAWAGIVSDQRQTLAQAVVLCEQIPHPVPRTRALFEIAEIQQKAGDRGGLRRTLVEAGRAIGRIPEADQRCSALLQVAQAQTRARDQAGAIVSINACEKALAEAEKLETPAGEQIRKNKNRIIDEIVAIRSLNGDTETVVALVQDWESDRRNEFFKTAATQLASLDYDELDAEEKVKRDGRPLNRESALKYLAEIDIGFTSIDPFTGEGEENRLLKYTFPSSYWSRTRDKLCMTFIRQSLDTDRIPEAQRAAALLISPGNVTVMLVDIAEALVEAGDNDAARATLGRAAGSLNVFRRFMTKDNYESDSLCVRFATTLKDAGDLEGAAAWMDTLEGWARETSSVSTRATHYGRLATGQYRIGDTFGYRRSRDKMFEAVGEFAGVGGGAAILAEFIAAQHEIGDADGYAAGIQKATELANGASHPGIACQYHLAIARVQRDAGDSTGCAATLTGATDAAGHVEDEEQRMGWTYIIAKEHALLGDPDAFIATLGRVISFAGPAHRDQARWTLAWEIHKDLTQNQQDHAGGPALATPLATLAASCETASYHHVSALLAAALVQIEVGETDAAAATVDRMLALPASNGFDPASSWEIGYGTAHLAHAQLEAGQAEKAAASAGISHARTSIVPDGETDDKRGRRVEVLLKVAEFENKAGNIDRWNRAIRAAENVAAQIEAEFTRDMWNGNIERDRFKATRQTRDSNQSKSPSNSG